MDNQNQQVYRTGSTNPPKSYGGIIAFLLMLVIFLSGIVTVLSMLNIRLFRELSSMQEEVAPVAFSQPLQTEGRSVTPQIQNISVFWGISGEEITPFYQHYYHIPQGIYVIHVEPESQAALQGLQEGDILLHLNGSRITTYDSLNLVLEDFTPGQQIQAVIFRDGQQHRIILTAEE